MIDQFISQFQGRAPKERLAMLGIAVVALIVLSVMIYSFIDRPPALDKYGCPTPGPIGNIIIVVDKTGEIPESARRSITNTILQIVGKAPAGTRISLFDIDSKRMRGLSDVIFSRCKTRDGSHASEYTENPELIRRRHVRDFEKPFLAAVNKSLVGTNQQRSPILEALVDITSVEAFQTPTPASSPLKLVLFSDLLQNTENITHYKGVQDFESAIKRPEVNRLIPSLANINIELYYLLRTGKELKLQTNKHVQFWLDYLEATQANVKLIKKIR